MTASTADALQARLAGLCAACAIIDVGAVASRVAGSLRLVATMVTDALQPPSGLLQGALHLFPVRVYYEDTDLAGVVYHANYLRWFERARSDMLRLLGIDQRAAAEGGQGTYAVAELSIRYRAPARLDDVVAIVTRASEIRAASVRLRQQASRGDELLAEAEVRVGFVAPDGRPRRQPAAWRAAFEAFSPAKVAA